MLTQKISGIILAGGKSSRMGTDKGFVHYKKKPLIQLALNLIQPYCSEVLISANSTVYAKMGVPVINDIIEDIGPLGGILSCLKQAKFEKSLVIACDMPSIESKIMNSLIEAHPLADLVYLTLPSGKIQSLPLILNRSTIQIIESQIDQNQFALHKFILKCARSHKLISQEVTIQDNIKNINTQNDLYSD
jgi:molybdopterin-guanine dinucleotide biosynthesis protein A